MRDRPVIYCGLAVFLALFTFPVWWGLAARTTTRGPQLAHPAGKECVAPVEYMKSSHMQYLIELRDKTVRGGVHTKKLTATCIEQCHGSKQEFCDRCHTYAAVSVSCWGCHLDSKLILRSAR